MLLLTLATHIITPKQIVPYKYFTLTVNPVEQTGEIMFVSVCSVVKSSSAEDSSCAQLVFTKCLHG